MGRRLILAALLSGCATTSPINASRLQAACDQQTTQFVPNAACLEATMRSLARPRTELQLYVSHAQALAARVRAGTMSEEEARYLQLSLRTELEAERRRRADAAGDDLMRRYEAGTRKSGRRIVTCHEVNGMVNCY